MWDNRANAEASALYHRTLMESPEASDARAYLASRGIDLSSKQETKTRSALEFFAKQLANRKTKAGRRQPRANTSAASTTTKSRA